jgi:tagatose 1,6-diphosphate aldolase
MGFEFLDPGTLDGGDFELVCVAKDAGDPERGLVPAYDFRIRVNGREFVGQVKLRIGMNDRIKLYAGNLGYKVDPNYRGRALAARAISLLLPVARRHGMNELWICCNPENHPSRKTCERIGAELVEIIEVPPGTFLYERGERFNCRYRLRLEETNPLRC